MASTYTFADARPPPRSLSRRCIGQRDPHPRISRTTTRYMSTTPSRLAAPPAARYNTPSTSGKRQTSPSVTDHAARRIHILGTGSVGKFLAHTIRSAPEPPPMSLLYHRPTFIASLQKPQCDISVTSDKVATKAGPFDVELVLPSRDGQLNASPGLIPNSLPSPGSGTGPGRPDYNYSDNDVPVLHPAEHDRQRTEYQYARFISRAPISQLIVTVKAHQTIPALLPLRHRLNPQSTVLFCQNGMGIIDEVCERIWPEEEDRPALMMGVNSHGVHATGPFSAVHAGHGVIYLGVLPRNGIGGIAADRFPSHTTSLHDHNGNGISTFTSNNAQNLQPTTRALLRTLTRIPLLSATAVPPTALHQRALEKLAINCVINPLTVLLDARNGALLHNHSLSRCFRLLLLEISSVFRALPELKGTPNLDVKFSPQRLEEMVVSVAERTGENVSSMLQDIRRGERTEIEYFNGYVVRRGEEVGMKCVMNYLVEHMVKGKQGIISKEVSGLLPFGGRL